MDINNLQNILSQVVDATTQKELEKTLETFNKLSGLSVDLKSGLTEITKAGKNLGGIVAEAGKFKGALASREALESMRAIAVATGAAKGEIDKLNNGIKGYKTEAAAAARELKKLDPAIIKKLGVEFKDLEGPISRSIRHIKNINKEYRQLKENYQFLGVALSGVEKGGKVAVSGVQQVYGSILSLLGLGVGIGAFFSLFKEGYTLSRQLGRSYIDVANSLGVIGIAGKKAFAPQLLDQMKTGIKGFKNELGLTREEALKIYEALGKEGVGRPVVSMDEFNKLSKLAGAMKILKGLSEETTFQYVHQNMRRFGNTTSQVGWQLDKMMGLSEEIGMDMSKYVPEVMSLSTAFEDQSISALTVAQALNKIYNSGYLAKYGLNLTLKEAGQVLQMISKLTGPQQFTPMNMLKAHSMYGGNMIGAFSKMQENSALGLDKNKQISAGFNLVRQFLRSSGSQAGAQALLHTGMLENILGTPIAEPLKKGVYADVNELGAEAAFNRLEQTLLLSNLDNNKDNTTGGEGFDIIGKNKKLIEEYKKLSLNEIQQTIDDFMLEVMKQADPVFQQMKKMLNSVLKMFGTTGDKLLGLGLGLPLLLGAAATLGNILIFGITQATQLALTSMILLKTAAMGSSKWGIAAMAGTGFLSATALNYFMGTAGDVTSQALTGKDLGGDVMNNPNEVMWSGKRLASSVMYGAPGMLAGVPGVGPLLGGVAGLGGAGFHGANIGSNIASNFQGQMMKYSQMMEKQATAVGDAAAQSEEANDKLVEISKDKDLLQSLDHYEKSLRKLSDELERAVKANEKTIDYLKLNEMKDDHAKHDHTSDTKIPVPSDAQPIANSNISSKFAAAGAGSSSTLNWDSSRSTLHNSFGSDAALDFGKLFPNAVVKSHEGDELTAEVPGVGLMNFKGLDTGGKVFSPGSNFSGFVSNDQNFTTQFTDTAGKNISAGGILDFINKSVEISANKRTQQITFAGGITIQAKGTTPEQIKQAFSPQKTVADHVRQHLG